MGHKLWDIYYRIHKICLIFELLVKQRDMVIYFADRTDRSNFIYALRTTINDKFSLYVGLLYTLW